MREWTGGGSDEGWVGMEVGGRRVGSSDCIASSVAEGRREAAPGMGRARLGDGERACVSVPAPCRSSRSCSFPSHCLFVFPLAPLPRPACCPDPCRWVLAWTVSGCASMALCDRSPHTEHACIRLQAAPNLHAGV